MADLPRFGDVLVFDRFRLDRTQRLLWANDRLVPLEPKVFETLLALVEAQGRLVTKDELLAKVWPDTFVEEGGLARHVSILRRVLGDGFIETITKRGYRFIADVRQPDAPDGSDPLAASVLPAAPDGSPADVAPAVVALAARRRLPVAWAALALALAAAMVGVWSLASARPGVTTALGSVRSIAVLPLRNLSGADQEYFSDGITEELITTLAQIQSLRVTSRTSIMRFKTSPLALPQIAKELGVDAVLEGSIQRDGDRVRITAQLIDARSDTHLWAHAYDERLADILTLQAAVARAIANQVEVRLSPRETQRLSATARHVVPGAHDAFLRGQALRWGGFADLRRAREEYDHAISLDPTYAPAYAGLALAWSLVNDPGAEASARSAAARALELDPDLPEAHAALAAVKYRDWDWEGGNAESRRALEVNPGALDGCYCYAITLGATGEFSESLAVADRALLSNPLSGGPYLAKGNTLHFSRRYEEAIATFKRGLEVDPNFTPNLLGLTDTYVSAGKAKEAIALLEHAKERDSPIEGLILASAYAQAGRRADALALIARYTAPGQIYDAISVARVFALLGEPGKALNWLERSLDVHEARALWILQPGFDPIRREPRFRALVTRLHMPAAFEAAEAAVTARGAGSPPS